MEPESSIITPTTGCSDFISAVASGLLYVMTNSLPNFPATAANAWSRPASSLAEKYAPLPLAMLIAIRACGSCPSPKPIVSTVVSLSDILETTWSRVRSEPLPWPFSSRESAPSANTTRKLFSPSPRSSSPLAAASYSAVPPLAFSLSRFFRTASFPVSLYVVMFDSNEIRLMFVFSGRPSTNLLAASMVGRMNLPMEPEVSMTRTTLTGAACRFISSISSFQETHRA